jgi:formylmethanofuran dehydrogenase subunit E
MKCNRCGEEVFFLYGRVINGEHYLLCWNCVVLVTEKEKV